MALNQRNQIRHPHIYNYMQVQRRHWPAVRGQRVVNRFKKCALTGPVLHLILTTTHLTHALRKMNTTQHSHGVAAATLKGVNFEP